MPYSIEKKGDQFCVYNNDTGEKVGEHDTRQKAVAQMRAIMANEGKDSKKSDGKKSDKKKKSDRDDDDHDY